ncbi:DinB family protein [Allobranchiibius sp. GilTou38]|uniref:DinB family protein n=1 Tax=Allobranchiibius sp. GilTou38 TaxID=2815210 RepID=UPI001AA1B4F1|nr:DinB family protein [Allobranchiibius sp. GilTou38]
MTFDGQDIVPDDKDWTWTLERRCPECGLAAGEVPAPSLAEELRRALEPWPDVALRAGARERRDPARWSDLEYACHVRDVCRVFAGRLRSMLTEDDPTFDDWDQDETAGREHYGDSDPSDVASELSVAAQSLVAGWAQVAPDAWGRTGVRSNGSRFTVLTLGQYCLHDLVHHGVDVAPLS